MVKNRAIYFYGPGASAIEICCDMIVVDENSEVDPAWHSERIKKGGYMPRESAPPTIGEGRGLPGPIIQLTFTCLMLTYLRFMVF